MHALPYVNEMSYMLPQGLLFSPERFLRETTRTFRMFYFLLTIYCIYTSHLPYNLHNSPFTCTFHNICVSYREISPNVHHVLE